MNFQRIIGSFNEMTPTDLGKTLVILLLWSCPWWQTLNIISFNYSPCNWKRKSLSCSVKEWAWMHITSHRIAEGVNSHPNFLSGNLLGMDAQSQIFQRGWCHFIQTYGQSLNLSKSPPIAPPILKTGCTIAPINCTTNFKAWGLYGRRLFGRNIHSSTCKLSIRFFSLVLNTLNTLAAFSHRCGLLVCFCLYYLWNW